MKIVSNERKYSQDWCQLHLQSSAMKAHRARGVCKHVEIASPDEFTSPYVWCIHIHGPLTRNVKFWVACAPGMLGTFSPPLTSIETASYRSQHVSRHVPWCMSGSLTRGGKENDPGIPDACATRNFTYLVRGPWVEILIHAQSLRMVYLYRPEVRAGLINHSPNWITVCANHALIIKTFLYVIQPCIISYSNIVYMLQNAV